MKNKIVEYFNKIKQLFIKNPIYLVIGIISIVILIIGSIVIGFIKTMLLIIIIDGIFILAEYLNLKKKKEFNENRSNEVMTNNKKTISKVKNNKEPKVKKEKSKETKLKKKNKTKKIIKIILIICFILGIAALIAVCLFFKMIIDEAPEFDVNNLIMQESSIVYTSDGEEFNRLGSENREIITYDELPEVLIDAIVATEDSRFFQHNGFDLPRFLKASLGQAAGKDAGGASTLTMQIVKNTFTDDTSKGFEGIKRKFTDIYMAIFKLEKNYTKQELLEFYVNYSFLGSNSNGVEQASLTYFNKSAKDLNLSEAALIAGLYQSPGSYDPLKGEEYAENAERRRLTVLKLMERHGYITEEERKIAEKLTVDKIVVGSRKGNVIEFQSFEDMVIKELEEKTDLNPNTMPLDIYTTMNKEKQTYINKIMSGENFWWENDKVQAGIAVIDVKTGAIIAIGSGRNIETPRGFNYATFDFDPKALRQIGSTAKPLYDYAPAIEYNNASTYGPVTDEPYTYTGGGEINNWDNGFQGFMTYREALRVSRNIPALKTFQSVSNAKIYEMATNLGLHPELEGGYVHEAHAIGAYNGESPVSLAAAYATFANSGYYNEPYSITKVVRRDTGEVVYEHKSNSRKAMGNDTAYMVTSMLQDTASWALGQYYSVNGVRYAAKSGTTNFDEKQLEAKGLPYSAINDLWIAGYDANYSIAVWYGYEKTNKELTAQGYYTASGNNNHARIFQEVAKAFFSGAEFEKPSNVVPITLEKETWPAMLPSEFTPSDVKITELFKAGTEPTETSTRYSKLSNVSNLKATQSGSKITLTWTKIKTPNAIDEDYIKNYFNKIYTNEAYRNGKLNDRLVYNRDHIGEVGYNIYIKDSDGTLKLVDFTKDNTYVHELKTTTSKNVTYVVKTCYTIFKNNMSDGVEVKVNVSANSTDIKAVLTTQNNVAIKVGTKYQEPTTPVKVTENGTDVTSKATIKINTITKKSDNSKVASVNDIITSKEDSYEIAYTASYNGETFTLIKTIQVIP